LVRPSLKRHKEQLKPIVEAIEQQAGQSQGKFWLTAGTVLKLTRVGRRIYAMRKAIVEPVFGQIKQAARKRLERPSVTLAYLCIS